jgi:hypothetical protein
MSSKGRTSSSPLTQELTIKDGGWPARRLSAVRPKALRVRKGQPWNPLADLSRRRETRPPSSAGGQGDRKTRWADLSGIVAQIPLNVLHSAVARKSRYPHSALLGHEDLETTIKCLHAIEAEDKQLQITINNIDF